MSAKLYVGSVGVHLFDSSAHLQLTPILLPFRNLSWNAEDEGLTRAFSEFGHVIDSVVMKDRETGRNRGFGFVTFASEAEAQAAIDGLNDQDLDGRRIRVNMAQAKSTGGGGGGYGGGGGGGYGGGGRGSGSGW